MSKAQREVIKMLLVRILYVVIGIFTGVNVDIGV